jgi:hypothetical protein
MPTGGLAAWVTPRAIDHGRVIAEFFRGGLVLPVPFGTLFSSSRALEDFLERSGEVIKGFFKNAAGCEEWGIKAMLDREQLKRSPIESIAGAEAVGVSSGLRYLRERRVDQMADQQSGPWLEQNLGAVAEALDQCATRSCQRRILDETKQLDGREEILNLAALLARDRVAEFRRCIEAIDRETIEGGLSFALPARGRRMVSVRRSIHCHELPAIWYRSRRGVKSSGSQGIHARRSWCGPSG